MPRKPTEAATAKPEDIFSGATAEYYQGNSALNRALLAVGNEPLRLTAGAVTAYTRARAHAQRVHEALVPPATNPTPLGLRPLGGDWGRWETAVGKPH